jgi:uncharacterized protein YdbL (DUF1318 family)
MNLKNEGGVMRSVYFLVIVLFLSLGCARVRVEAPKDPIKLDISMRLDIYQHVAKDIDAIEDIVSGSGEKTPDSKQGSMLDIFVESAYAEEGLSPEVEQAALNRRDRRPQLVSLEGSGVVAENNLGLVEIKRDADSSIKALVEAENNDRMVIYRAIAAKNGISIEEVQKLYAKKLQENMAGK